MNKTELQTQIDLYIKNRGPFRKFFNWNSAPIRELEKLMLSKEIKNLTADKPLDQETIAQIRKICNHPEQGGDLTRMILANIDRALNVSLNIPSLTPSNTNINAILKRLSVPPISIDSIFGRLAPKGAAPKNFNPEVENQKPAKQRVRKIFYGEPELPVSHYRNGVYNQVKFSDAGMQFSADYQPELISNVSKHVCRETDKEKLTEGQYYACFELENKKGWQLLPSPAVYSELTAMRSNDCQFELGKLSNLYFIKINSDNPEKIITIEYNMTASSHIPTPEIKNVEEAEIILAQLPNHDLSLLKNCAPETQCAILSQFFNSFSEQYETNEPSAKPMQEKWVDLLKNKTGVCRHRAAWFMEIAKELNLPTQLVVNDIHAFVEVNIRDEWRRIDLGGGKIECMIEEPIRPFHFGCYTSVHTDPYRFNSRILESFNLDPADVITIPQIPPNMDTLQLLFSANRSLADNLANDGIYGRLRGRQRASQLTITANPNPSSDVFDDSALLTRR